MKKNVIKMAVAAVCVVAAGMGGMKAYNAANQSEVDMLLSENVEALSQRGEVIIGPLCGGGGQCYIAGGYGETHQNLLK